MSKGEREREAVDSEVPPQVERRCPGDVGDELGTAGVVTVHQECGGDQSHQRDARGYDPDLRRTAVTDPPARRQQAQAPDQRSGERDVEQHLADHSSAAPAPAAARMTTKASTAVTYPWT